MLPNQNKIKKIALIFCLFPFIFILATACNTTEPPPVIPPQPKPVGITIKLITKSSTEIFLTVSAKDSILPAPVTIKRDDKEIMDFYLTMNDTTVIDTGLAAGKTYAYKPIAKVNGKEEVGDSLIVATLDTTSNNFVWQTYTFGENNSSKLLDVAIISENDIWAVGEIYMNDSTGNADPNAYNAVHWNGSEWKLKRITTEFHGYYITVPLEGIKAFGKNDIWFVGSLPIHWDGNNSIMYDVRTTTDPNLSLSKAWGTNTNDMYFVGRGGSIAHYNGSSWRKIASGTTTNINDVWGINDEVTNKSLVLCTVSSRYHIGDYKLLSISGNTAKEYFSWPYTRLYGIWFNSPQKIYIVGDGGYLYENNKISRIDLPTNYFLTRVKGTDLNNIFISGCCNTLLHFNGVRWQTIQGIYGNYEGLDVKGNTVVAVGWTSRKALILLGRRQ